MREQISFKTTKTCIFSVICTMYMYIAMQFLKWFCFKKQITITVADRITEIHPATNLLSYQSTFLQEGARNFTLKKK